MNQNEKKKIKLFLSLFVFNENKPYPPYLQLRFRSLQSARFGTAQNQNKNDRFATVNARRSGLTPNAANATSFSSQGGRGGMSRGNGAPRGFSTRGRGGGMSRGINDDRRQQWKKNSEMGGGFQRGGRGGNRGGGAPRGFSTRGRGGRGTSRGGRGRGRGGKQDIDITQLDKELTNYLSQDPERAKNMLDTDLDSYMKERSESQS